MAPKRQISVTQLSRAIVCWRRAIHEYRANVQSLIAPVSVSVVVGNYSHRFANPTDRDSAMADLERYLQKTTIKYDKITPNPKVLREHVQSIGVAIAQSLDTVADYTWRGTEPVPNPMFEQTITISIDSFDVVGRIDALLSAASGVRIVEFKTGVGDVMLPLVQLGAYHCGVLAQMSHGNAADDVDPAAMAPVVIHVSRDQASKSRPQAAVYKISIAQAVHAFRIAVANYESVLSIADSDIELNKISAVAHRAFCYRCELFQTENCAQTHATKFYN